MKSIKRLILIRHGESEANRERRYQGQSYDTDLSVAGMIQAQSIRAAAPLSKIDRVFSSPLKRTMQTAAVFGLPIIPEPLLLEINHGSWEGKTVDEFDLQEKQLLHVWKNAPHQTHMPGGEHFNDVVARCQVFLDLVSGLEGTTVAVTHDAIIRIILAIATRKSYDRIWDMPVDNGSIHIVSLKPPTLIQTNFIAHLGNSHISSINQVL